MMNTRSGCTHFWDKGSILVCPDICRMLKMKHAVLQDCGFLLVSETGRIKVSESTVSNTELSEFFGPHRLPGSELSEFLSAYYFVCQSELTEFSAELTEFAPKLSEAQ